MFLIPTSGRPESVKELISACRLFGMPEKCAVMVGPPKSLYDGVRWPAGWHIHHDDQNAGMVRATNKLFEMYPEEPWYGFLNDRARPVEERWIERLLEAVDGGWANQASLGVNPRTGRIRMKNGIMDGDLVRKHGWFWPPEFRHLWVDDAMEDILYSQGLFHQTDVKIVEVQMPKHPRLSNDAAVYRDWSRRFACSQ